MKRDTQSRDIKRKHGFNNFCDSCDLDNLTAPTHSHDDGNFLYLKLQFGHREVSALLDTGSSINLMSQKLFNSLPTQNKSDLIPVDSSSIVLANNQSVSIDGISSISGYVQGHFKEFDVYVLKDTSHPLILGTHFIKSNKLVLDFSSKIFSSKILILRFMPKNVFIYLQILSLLFMVKYQNALLRD